MSTLASKRKAALGFNVEARKHAAESAEQWEKYVAPYRGAPEELELKGAPEFETLSYFNFDSLNLLRPKQ